MTETTLLRDPDEPITPVTVRPDTRPRVKRIFVSRPLRTRLLCLAYFLVIVAVAVGADRLLAGRLFTNPSDFIPAYRAFPEYAIGAKLNQFENEHRRWDAFVIGNSRPTFGVDPATLDGGLAQHGIRIHSYNLSFLSVDPQFWPDFFTRYYNRPVPPRVFLAILPRDLEAHYTATPAFTAEFNASPGFTNRDMSSVNKFSENELSQLYFLHGRSTDLRLIAIGSLLSRVELNINPIHLIGTQGWMRLPQSQLLPKATLLANERKLRLRHGSMQFELGPQWQSIVKLSAWLRQRGSCLTLFTTPILYDEEQWGTLEMRRGFYTALRKLLRANPNIGFVDTGRQFESSMVPADFGDGDHLRPHGARRFSRALANSIAPAFSSGACTARG
jgi:hypothetical protein